MNLPPFRAARLAALLQERDRRRAPVLSPERQRFDPFKLAIERQKPFLADRAQFRCVDTSRRAGKSTGFALDIFQEAENFSPPNSTIVYLNTTRERATRTIWETLKGINDNQGLNWRPNESKHFLRGPGNRWIYVSGGENKKNVNKWRGTLPPVWAAYIDEAQDWDANVLEYAIWAVLGAALVDVGGRLTVGGTPGPMPDPTDPWFALTQNEEFSYHHWTMWENEKLKNPRAVLEKVMRARGVDENDPTIQREFFGRWVADTEALVFGAVDDQLNLYHQLPVSEYWRYVVGIDFGFVDSSAVEVIGSARDASEKMFVCLNRAFAKVGPTDTVPRVMELLGPFMRGLVGAVGDPGGGGSGMMDDMRDKFGLDIEAAEKTEKVTACRLLADALRARDLLLPADDVETKTLIRDLRRVQWHPDHRGRKLKGHTPDRVDALLYGHRKAWPTFRYTPPQPPPSPDHEFLQRVRDREDYS